jgi:penicillin-binding protein 1A
MFNKLGFWFWYHRCQLWHRYTQFNNWLNGFRDRKPLTYKLMHTAGFVLNMTVIGIVALYLLSRPAMDEFNENILHKQELSVTFLDRNGEFIGRRGIRLDDSMQLNEYPKYFLDAVLATEDRRFYSHFGIDIVGTTRAVVSNSHGKHMQGGSSITQQLAKNLFLSNERTLQRKVKEAFLALALEWNFSKEEILKLYLERAYMGGGAYGAAEASKHYFNKSAKDLSVSEAAILAGLFKAPSKFSPDANPEESRKRWLTVLENLKNTRSITDEQYEEALLYPPQPNIFRDNSSANYYLDWAWEEVKRLEAEGRLGNNKVLKITTTLDLAAQRSAEAVMDKQLEEADDKYDTDEVAMVVMGVDGDVLTMIGGSDYRTSSFNRVTKAMRQPGSSFKPYVYAAAVDAGILDKDTIVNDRPTCIGKWCPNNYGRSFSGSMPAWQALAQSINSIPVQLSIQLGQKESSVKAGRAKIIEMAHRMGVRSELYDTQSLPIGSVEITPLDQAVGYATLANGGYRVQPYAISEVRTSSGEVVFRQEIVKERVLSDRVVSNLNFMLNKVVDAGTGGAAKIPGQVVAGKTGTTNAYRDAWFVGYTGSMVGAVWMGNDDNSSSEKMTGGSLPARTWRLVMEQALKAKPTKAPPFLVDNTVKVANTGTKQQAQQPRPAPVSIAPKEFQPPEVKERGFFERLFGSND